MKILFDQGTPAPLRMFFARHVVDTAYELGWSELRNGELLAAAARDGYQVFVTTDQNLKHQQNLTGSELAILILRSTSWVRLKKHGVEIVRMVETLQAGSYGEFDPD